MHDVLIHLRFIKEASCWEAELSCHANHILITYQPVDRLGLNMHVTTFCYRNRFLGIVSIFLGTCYSGCTYTIIAITSTVCSQLVFWN
jgi:hypothetical protein